MNKYFLLILIALIVASCIDFTSPERHLEQQFYLTGFLVAGKIIDFDHAVFLGKTIPVEGGVIEDLVIYDAAVMLFEMDENDILLDSTSLHFAINPFNDEQFGYIDPTGNIIIEAENKYRIEAVIDSQNTVWATTQVPKSIQVVADSLVTQNSGYTSDPELFGWPEMVFETIDVEHPIQIVTQDNEIINLFAEFYCLENWQDAQYIHSFGGTGYPEDEEEYENPGDGSPRQMISFYSFQPQNNLVNFSFYQYAYVFFGRYQVTINSIDNNFYQYLYKPEGFNHGGINGGIGYFGSTSSNTMFTKIVEE